MQLKTESPEISYQVLDIVGSSDYGKDTKILASRTFNMMKSDDWLTGYAGYKKQLATSAEGEGRGIFSSPKANAMIVVTNGDVFSVSLFSTGSDGKKKGFLFSSGCGSCNLIVLSFPGGRAIDSRTRL